MDTRTENYEIIWDKVILPSLQEVCNKSNLFTINENAKQLILENYMHFNDYCRNNYMMNPKNKLDRHKVSACYIYAIIKSSPIITNAIFQTDEEFCTVNEDIALTVGLSIMRSFCSADKNCPILPYNFSYPETAHGDYRSNFVVELYFTKKEKNYNILSLSHSLFLLEMFNRQYWKK